MHVSIPGLSEPVRPGKLICVGRNYAAHAAEMKSAVPSEPMLFLKPSTALVATGGAVVIPPHSSDVHHEVELVVAVGAEARGVSEGEAMRYVAAYAAGLDMTARDVQAKAKAKGHPWSVAKGFDTFAPLGEFVAAERVADPHALGISLRVSGAVRQEGSTADMIFSVAALVSYASRIFTLEPGDLIYTGTPEGVGPVVAGDHLVAEIDGLPALEVDVKAA
jgi:2-keto-4-pentenoate hydratase/2-oxohepta-3-ene-1,7-dioic acid hydratase in catechol pathway